MVACIEYIERILKNKSCGLTSITRLYDIADICRCIEVHMSVTDLKIEDFYPTNFTDETWNSVQNEYIAKSVQQQCPILLCSRFFRGLIQGENMELNAFIWSPTQTSQTYCTSWINLKLLLKKKTSVDFGETSDQTDPSNGCRSKFQYALSRLPKNGPFMKLILLLSRPLPNQFCQ